MPDAEFKPCPFCGSKIVGALQESTNPHDALGVVRCGVCGACGPSLFESYEFTARWNHRDQDTRIAELERQLATVRAETFERCLTILDNLSAEPYIAAAIRTAAKEASQ